MEVLAGSTDVTTYFNLQLAADGTGATGLTITDLDLQYVRSGATPAAKVDATALAATNSAHGDNQAIEIDGTDQPGLYRVDWPDAAFAAGVREVVLTVKHTTCFPAHLRVNLTPVPANVESWNNTAVPSEHTAGYPIVTIKDGTGTGELNTNAGAIALVDLVTTTSTETEVTTVNGLAANVITATSIASDAFTAAKFHSDVTTELQSGLATAAELAKVPKSDSNVTWNPTALASIQSEANDALVANNLDHLFAAVDTDWATTVHVNSALGHLAETANGGFDRSTDSQEAIRDRGDAAWITATGFSTHGAADVWAVGTRSLTILDEDSTTLDLDATIRAAVGLAAANLDTQIGDLPTNAELATALAAADDAVLAAIAALNNLSAAQVNAEVLDVLNVDTFAEPTGVPAATTSMRLMLGFLYSFLFRNKITVTSTKMTFHDDGDAAEFEKDVSDDGTTYTESEANSV
jgi:hypothetical protein